MIQTLSVVTRRARKDYEDSAGVWIKESLSDLRSCGELTFSELRTIAELKSKNWKILKGEMYEHAVCKQYGQLYTFRCNPKVNAICLKLDLYCDC